MRVVGVLFFFVSSTILFAGSLDDKRIRKEKQLWANQTNTFLLVSATDEKHDRNRVHLWASLYSRQGNHTQGFAVVRRIMTLRERAQVALGGALLTYAFGPGFGPEIEPSLFIPAVIADNVAFKFLGMPEILGPVEKLGFDPRIPSMVHRFRISDALSHARWIPEYETAGIAARLHLYFGQGHKFEKVIAEMELLGGPMAGEFRRVDLKDTTTLQPCRRLLASFLSLDYPPTGS